VRMALLDGIAPEAREPIMLVTCTPISSANSVDQNARCSQRMARSMIEPFGVRKTELKKSKAQDLNAHFYKHVSIASMTPLGPAIIA
jgi:hypothetical protein